MGRTATMAAAVSVVLLWGSHTQAWAAGPSKPPSKPNAAQLKRVVGQYFATVKDYQRGDLISQRDVATVVAALKTRGWSVPDATRLVGDALPASDFLVQLFQQRHGRRFMREVAGHRLIYDRLDRVAQVRGGTALLRDLVKLPDGARYARWKPGRAVPDLVDLLPKGRSGKRRSIKDYREPTGKIYTQQDLLERLEEAFENAKKSGRSSPSPGR